MNQPGLKPNQLSLGTKPQPWDRQPGEPPKAWNAFVQYRNMGISKRSLRAVGENLASKEELAESGSRVTLPPVMITVDLDAPKDRARDGATREQRKKASGRITGWSTHWKWVERVAAWEAFCDERIKNQALSKMQELAKRQQDYLRSLHVAQSIVPATLLRKLNTPEGKVWLESIPMDDLLRLSIEISRNMRRFQEAERLAHGIHVSADQDTIGQFIWELKLKQPPAHASEPSESSEGSENESDPYNVAPAWDPVR